MNYLKIILLYFNKITVEHQENAIVLAQEEMQKSVEGDKALFEQADKRAKELIENYINKIGEATNKKYNIEWKTL